MKKRLKQMGENKKNIFKSEHYAMIILKNLKILNSSLEKKIKTRLYDKNILVIYTPKYKIQKEKHFRNKCNI